MQIEGGFVVSALLVSDVRRFGSVVLKLSQYLQSIRFQTSNNITPQTIQPNSKRRGSEGFFALRTAFIYSLTMPFYSV